ncbi:DUF1697 domain-containing protein [Levilactobacillus yiduensis]|uniref:DUF1697 domain-containing protein n=1 Tax=Levilactobacillus yiduensis TaxID=2953880 RepID=UPI000EF2BC68|nr:DUF1697 domain-containing protein [Levilactobacillus yiduensis]AYM02373.1 DUF1697 domain-containing protein [Levilactobacillus brevis]
MTNLLILRAINAGTPHQLKMADLRDWLQAAGATAVQTVGNTGNCLFDCSETSAVCQAHMANLLATHVDFAQPFGLLTGAAYLHDMAQAPNWWGSGPTNQHMLLVKLTTYTADQDTWLTSRLTVNDRVAITPHLIFWTVTGQDFRRSAYGQLNGSPFYQQTSTRSYRTAMRLQTRLTQRGAAACYTK